jgi:hypothetical protein
VTVTTCDCDARCSAGAGAEETAVLPEEDAEVDAMQHQEMAYEEQVTCDVGRACRV